ncbi:MAG: cation acetate symporter, partial [Candidatus Hydrogenedentota bacterium]
TAHGTIPWAVNGMAFAGAYLSAASFLGICGLIAFYGYDGFLYSIGYLAGWIVALLVIAEPIKRLGKFTFADALDGHFGSRSIKLAAAISTLVVSAFYLIPQMVGAGALITPLLGLPHYAGVVLVGITVTLIVVTAGMVSTTWVQFIKGSLLVVFCTVLTVLILLRGFSTSPGPRTMDPSAARQEAGVRIVEDAWPGKPYAKIIDANGDESIWRVTPEGWVETQAVTKLADGTKLVNGLPQTKENDLRPVGTLTELADGTERTGPIGPLNFFGVLGGATVVTWTKDTLKNAEGSTTTVYWPSEKKGNDLLTPGGYFTGIRSKKFADKLDFISLMLALFCGTASLPHILIRYYTVKDQASARKSTVVGIAAIGFFYVLTLYLGLGAMTSGAMDVTDNNMAAPLLARSFNEFMFAVISAIAFTTVLGTVSGLIMAGSGAVAHDLLENVLHVPMTDRQKVLYGKSVAVVLGVGAMVLGVLFKDFNVSFLVGWAFNIAASANLPALVMMLFWRRTTKQGIAAAVTVGLLSSLAWVLLSGDTYSKVYGWDPATSYVPFSQPALVTIPLGFLTLIVVSFVTPKPARSVAEELAEG